MCNYRIFWCHKALPKNDDVQKQFMEDLMFYIYKGYMPLFTCENVWFED